MEKKRRRMSTRRATILKAPPSVQVKFYQHKFFTTSDYATKRVLAPFCRIVRKDGKPKTQVKTESLTSLIGKKPSVLMKKISQFLTDTVDLTALLNETAFCMKTVTEATGVHLYIVDSELEEIYYSSTRLRNTQIKIKWKQTEGTTIAAYVATTKQHVMSDNILGDRRFPEGLGYKDETVKSVLCVPVMMPDKDIFAVIELYRDSFKPSFVIQDLVICTIVCTWLGAAVHQNRERLDLEKQLELNDYLIDLCKCYFSDSIPLDKLISEIVSFSKVLLKAERGTFYNVDKEKDELVADIDEESGIAELGPRKRLKIRFHKSRGIAGTAARTGNILNIKDAYSDPRFNREIDDKTGFITRSILCMPIKDSEGILGVVQLINKIDNYCFSSMDEILFNTFTVYFAFALSFSQKKLTLERHDLKNKSKIEVLMHQIKPCIHDSQYFAENWLLDLIPSGLNEFKWYHDGPELELLPILLYMFIQVFGKDELSIRAMRNFFLSIQKLYRNLPFHNFTNAFYFTHSMYCILIHNKRMFTPTELKALMIGGLCKDLDHPGFSNPALLEKNCGYLCKLYYSLYLENYHFFLAKTVCDTYNIFPKMSNEERLEFYEKMKSIILLTNFSCFLQERTKYKYSIKENVFDLTDSNHREYLLLTMITVCDYFFVVKSLEILEKWSIKLSEELYDEEVKLRELGFAPLSNRMRRRSEYVPESLHLSIQLVLVPCAISLAHMLPSTESYLFSVKTTKTGLMHLMTTRGEKTWNLEDSLVK